MTINIQKRIDLHMHTLISDGVLVPSELIRRAADKDYEAVALTDHADAANIDHVIGSLKNISKYSSDAFGIKVLFGVELTHVPPGDILNLAKYAKKKGAQIVVVHGETPVEPVARGTNHEALCAKGYVDILAHPGFIEPADAQLAAKNNILLEITSRKGHNWTNGHVVLTGKSAGASFIVNTDTHTPGDLISLQEAIMVARGAGLTADEALLAVNSNPRQLIKRFT